MNRSPHPGPEVDGSASEPVDPRATAREVVLKLLPYVIGALLVAGFIAAHLLLGLRPQH